MTGESLATVVTNIIDKFKIKEIVITIMIICGILLFAPKKLISILGLLEWRDSYRSYIGVTLLFGLVCCLIWVLSWSMSRVNNEFRLSQKISRKYLKRTISTKEKEYLIENFFNRQNNEFDTTATLDVTSGYILPLKNACIIYKSGMATYNQAMWAYNLEPNVRVYLNKAVRRKKIIINSTGYIWKL